MESTRKSGLGGDREISSPAVFAVQPTVSVIMLAYNHGEYLEQAIGGVLEQQVQFPVELLIGEDCSTDNTRDLALRCQRESPGIVRVITSDTNVGSLLNYRRVLAAARGEFIAYLDGDDYWLPGKLAKQIAFMRANPGCAGVYTNAITVDREGERMGLFNDVGSERFDLPAMLRRGNFLNNSSMVFRAAARSGLLEITTSHIDYQSHLRLAREGYLAQLGEPLAAYRVRAKGSMVLNMNDHVRELYWQAVQSIPRGMVSDGDFAGGVADFLRRVFFRTVRTRRWSLLRQWIPRVLAASPYSRTRTLLLTVDAIARIAIKELIGMFRRGPDGRRSKVLYRR